MPEVLVKPADPIPGVHAFGCQSFRIGHRVHAMQGVRSADVYGEYESCVIVEITADGWFTLEMLGTGERRRYWHHDLARIVERAGSRLSLNERWHTLRIGGKPISISREPSPCVHEEAGEPPDEGLETHGSGEPT